MSLGTIDLMVIGQVDAAGLAAVGLGHTWSMASLVVGMGLCFGLDPWFTQGYGAGNAARVGSALRHGSLLLAASGVLITVAHLLAGPAMIALGQPATTVPAASTYAMIVAWSVLPFLGFTTHRQLLQARSDMRSATVIILIGNLVNLLADIGLVWWLDGGVAGVAWATVTVRWFMWLALMAWRWEPVQHVLAASRWDRTELRALSWVAVPIAVQIAVEVWAFNATTFIAGWLGEQAVATHTAALNLSSMAFMLPLGMSAAAATRVGNLAGAGRPWPRAAWTAVGLGAVTMVFTGAVFVGFPQQLGALYTSTPAEAAAVAMVVPIAAAYGLFDGVQVVSMGVLRGLGDTRAAAVIAVVAYWGVALPMAVVGADRLGLQGLWWALALGLAASATLLVARIRWHGHQTQLPA